MGLPCGAITDLDYAFTTARSGATALLPADGDDLVRAKALLKRLNAEHGYPLGENGLPIKQGEIKAAHTWALFAVHAEGKEIVRECLELAVRANIWCWPVGCIEDVLRQGSKGEDAILAHEERLRDLDADQIDGEMPEFRHCLDWIRGLLPESGGPLRNAIAE
jgi:hypothetical protein